MRWSNNPAVPEDAVVGGERKLATVLFADLVGSTALASGEDPERVRFRLERFYEGMADEVQGAGGTVEKFAGDAVMAVFGAPAALEDHAERALHAALAMQRRLGELFRGELAAEELAQSALHGQRRMQSAFRMILEGGGRPEDSHDRIPCELLHCSAGALDLVRHPLVESLQAKPDPLGVLPRRERCRADQIGEKHGGQFSFPTND